MVNYKSVPLAILEVSKHYEDGARKYAERNWEKGINCHCYVDSGVRHLLRWLDGWTDEPHDRAFIWNMLGLLWTVKHHPELNDLPYTEHKTTLSNEEIKYINDDVDALTDISKEMKGFSVDFDPGICITCPYFSGTYKKCDKGIMVNSKIVDCNRHR